MTEPLQKPADDQNSPAFGAIIPEKNDGDVDNFLNEFENYQKKLDEEWEKAKESHQKKVNQIMEEYLNQKFEEKDFKPSAQGKEKGPSNQTEKQKIPEPQISRESDSSLHQNMETLLARVERELRRSGKSRGFSLFDDLGPNVINVSSRSARSLFKKIIQALGVLGLAGAALYFSLIFPNQVAPATNLPYSHASGILVSGDKVYLTDWFRKALYIHQIKRGLPIISVEHIPNNFITGLALSDKNLWTMDGFDNKLIRHSLAEEHQAIEKFPAPGTKPAGIFWDGADLWAADNQTKILYQFKLTDMESPFNQYQFPQMTVTSFLLDKGKVWVLDGENREVQVLRLQNPLRNLATFDLDPFLSGATPTGMAFWKDFLLLTTNQPPQIIRVPLGKLKKSTAKVF